MIEARNEMASSSGALKLGVFSFLLLLAPSASAAAPWVDRAITLPGRSWAFNFGLGIQHVPNSLIEMGRCYGASPFALYGKIVLLAALPEILAGIRLGLVRGVKGVVIGQLLVAIIGYGELFELYSRSFDMENFWALTIILFAAAMLMSAAIEHIEKKVDYYAGVR